MWKRISGQIKVFILNIKVTTRLCVCSGCVSCLCRILIFLLFLFVWTQSALRVLHPGAVLFLLAGALSQMVSEQPHPRGVKK